MEPVKFYATFSEYGELSTSFPCKITMGTKCWPSVEHYYQSRKFTRAKPAGHYALQYAEIIRNADTPEKAYWLGKQTVPNKGAGDPVAPGKKSLEHIVHKYVGCVHLARDWENAKERVMLKALKVKFAPGTSLYRVLESTKGRAIINQDPNDGYWGVGPDGDGSNVLGKMLVAIRDDQPWISRDETIEAAFERAKEYQEEQKRGIQQGLRQRDSGKRLRSNE